ncbi:alanine--tRNA ligase [Brachymonas sp. M4Q-1]|uniref:alanine--tRNA ligase n=1 Tax=Brachymonas sp. M4Q-1 TaxID=3416906 RepID=UPI003CF62916
MTTPMTVAEIRKTFLDFFASKGHTIVPSSPLVPLNDPTLMFTNSGMVQFKDVFLGTDKRPYHRATSVQACLRAGGKHNDLENVGYTARHHTFFEMLGNWSFGDYFKKESITWGWELLTQVYGLPADKLTATVYHEDDEAYDIWTKDIGLPPERVIRIGDNKGGKYKSDNFWMMADTGPCGPCSEIFYDHGADIAGGPPGSPDEDGDRFIEIWNHVFMQFEMHEDGSLTRLPAPCVDTGMGLERLAAILQHVHSNYEIDLFQNLIRAAARETGCTDLANPSLKVIADHIRATAFLVSDGVLPGNEGRSYVQRRIIRRAIRHGYKLGCKKPFFHRLVPDLVALMGDAYPRLKAQEAEIASALQAEEERFFETLEKGMNILDEALAGDRQTLSGDIAFKLHDTYGFPLDLTQDVCRERGVTVDEAGFENAMQHQKDTARAAGKFKMDKVLEYEGASNTFTGYEHLEEEAQVLALYVDGESVSQLRTGDQGVIVLDVTPFYAESGGQVGDQGLLRAPGIEFQVTDTHKIKADVFGHHGVLLQGVLRVGDRVRAEVSHDLRFASMRNHSATHLLHKALREVLGSHVQQKGSLVTPERTRFDFAHGAALTPAQIAEVEHKVNAEILANTDTRARVMPMEDARQTGAMMLFGEKYGDEVRVLDIGSSTELCGGTHVGRTGDIGLFKIVTEGGVASGVRRIEAVTGANALAYLQGLEHTVSEAAQALKTPPSELLGRIGQLQEQTRHLEKEIAALKGKLASSQGDELAGQAVDVKGVKVLAARLEGADARTLRETMDKLKDKLKSAAIVLAAVEGDKVQIAAGVTKDRTAALKAGELVNFVAQQVGGKGGGKPDMAMAGGTQPAHLDQALQGVQAWVAERL